MGMRLKILGTRGEILPSAPKYARHSGILIDARILLDLGEVAYLRHGPQHIFVVTDAEIYLPEPTRRLPTARVMSRPVQNGSYRIVPVPTVHSLKVRSLSYVVENRGWRVFFSSDLVSVQRRYHRRLPRLNPGHYRGKLYATGPPGANRPCEW
jgi:hypothetical protein